MISIIGAGPAGSYLAYLLAKSNHEVNVYEEHKEIGKPVQCSGVITKEIKKLIPLKKEIIVNKINKIRIYSPNNNFFETKIPQDYVFNRMKLDQYLADLAKKAGANFYTKRFLDLERNKDKIKLKFNKGFKETDKLVGADGPYSQVAKSSGLFKDRKFIVGLQAKVKTKILSKNTVEIFLGYGEFGWLIPEDEYTARIGVVSEKNPKQEFNSLMKKLNAKFICYQSGMIPIYNPKQETQKNNIYLIGDAATQIKQATHGGILYSMLAGKCLTKSINENKSYESLWKKELGLNLWLNLKIRNTLLKFSEKDYNNLVGYFKKPEMKEVLAKNTRDFPSKFILQLLLKEPKLLKYSFKAL